MAKTKKKKEVQKEAGPGEIQVIPGNTDVVIVQLLAQILAELRKKNGCQWFTAWLMKPAAQK